MPFFSGSNYYKPQDWLKRADTYEGGTNDRMIQSWNQGQGGLQDYQGRLGQAADPWASADARNRFLGSMSTNQSAVQGMMDRPGFSPEQIASMSYSPEEAASLNYSDREKAGMASGVAAPYRAAQSDMQRRSVATGNHVGVNPMAMQMAQQRGTDISGLAGKWADQRVGASNEVAKARMGAAGEGAKAEQQGREYSTQASQYAPEAFGQWQQREAGYLPLFQFGPEYNQRNYAGNQGEINDLMQQRLQMTGQSQQNAQQGGAFNKILALGDTVSKFIKPR